MLRDQGTFYLLPPVNNISEALTFSTITFKKVTKDSLGTLNVSGRKRLEHTNKHTNTKTVIFFFTCFYFLTLVCLALAPLSLSAALFTCPPEGTVLSTDSSSSSRLSGELQPDWNKGGDV